jgi:hypothetical protein
MGLDMYLNRVIYMSGNSIEEKSITAKTTYITPAEYFSIDTENIQEISVQILYWRKSNWLHAWFNEVLGGVDNCEKCRVPEEVLIDLSDKLAIAILTVDPTVFKPSEGFFFGSTEIDEYYWDDLKETLKIIKPIADDLKKPFEERDSINKRSSFTYEASW